MVKETNKCFRVGWSLVERNGVRTSTVEMGRVKSSCKEMKKCFRVWLS